MLVHEGENIISGLKCNVLVAQGDLNEDREENGCSKGQEIQHDDGNNLSESCILVHCILKRVILLMRLDIGICEDRPSSLDDVSLPVQIRELHLIIKLIIIVYTLKTRIASVVILDILVVFRVSHALVRSGTVYIVILLGNFLLV